MRHQPGVAARRPHHSAALYGNAAPNPDGAEVSEASPVWGADFVTWAYLAWRPEPCCKSMRADLLIGLGGVSGRVCWEPRGLLEPPLATSRAAGDHSPPAD